MVWVINLILSSITCSNSLGVTIRKKDGDRCQMSSLKDQMSSAKVSCYDMSRQRVLTKTLCKETFGDDIYTFLRWHFEATTCFLSGSFGTTIVVTKGKEKNNFVSNHTVVTTFLSVMYVFQRVISIEFLLKTAL